MDVKLTSAVATLEAPTIALVVVDAASPPPQAPVVAPPPAGASEDGSLIVPLAAVAGIGVFCFMLVVIVKRRLLAAREAAAANKTILGTSLPKVRVKINEQTLSERSEAQKLHRTLSQHRSRDRSHKELIGAADENQSNKSSPERPSFERHQPPEARGHVRV